MLHNSGPYGPNDVPINMGAPVNMTQMSTPMNISNSLGNLAKNPPQTPQTSVPPYNMPDYSSFGHPALNMGHSMTPFGSYHPLNFQANYGHGNPNLHHDTSLNSAQNGMLPMNLNVQSDQSPNLRNYPTFEPKRMDINTPNYRENYSRPMPINVPQIHTKAFHKQLGMDSNYGQFNTIPENPFYNQEVPKTPQKSIIDSNRRKSLENTVKLIENILINSTPRDKSKSTEPVMNIPNVDIPANSSSKTAETETCENVELNKTKASLILNDNTHKPKSTLETLLTGSYHSKPKETEQRTEKNTLVDMNSLKIDMTITNSDLKDKTQSMIHCKPLKHSLLNNNKISKSTQNDNKDNDGKETDSNSEVNNIKLEIEEVVTIKVEPWSNEENVQMFLRDCNATARDDIGADSVIIDGDNTVAEATQAAKNGSKPDTFYECLHCNLIFKHPKRYLIHTKWHSFGLTNERRQELAKEKEMRKNMKKEARIMERLNLKESKEQSSEDTVHPCKDCDKVFKVKSSLKNHRQRHHPTRVRECKICNATVVGWMALREHLNTHTGGGGYQCPVCPKRFKYSHSLAKHRDTHLEKTHGCDQCEKKFGSQTLLKMHMKCHERTARGTTFRCTYCGKGFYESYNLQVHERTHRNERPFLCDICNSSFGTNSSLKRHLKVSHSTSKPFACETCKRCFATANTRDRHTARAHGDISIFEYACTLCPRRYRVPKELQKHMYKIHPKKRDVEQD